ncbi:ANTAR domain-containing protein [Spirillospora sp. NPDC048823]|uniref:ANTAR domain-containing protein n=1 Tax=unclassified Spirillospora TaxID=2642701 RepID=UPI0037242EBE
MADDTSRHDFGPNDPDRCVLNGSSEGGDGAEALGVLEGGDGPAGYEGYRLSGDAVAELQQLLLATESVEGFMQDIAQLAAGTIGVGLSCGITMKTDGRPTTVASSDALAEKVDEVQYQLDRGPCLYSMRSGEQVLLKDLHHPDRWGDYAAHALEHGVRASLSMPLHPGGDSQGRGALNIYAPTIDAFGPEQISQASGYAQILSGAVALAVRIADQAALTAHLRTALTSRATIDQAIGVVMARRRCPPEQAFEILRQTSQNNNAKLRDVAARLVAETARRPSPHPGAPRT